MVQQFLKQIQRVFTIISETNPDRPLDVNFTPNNDASHDFLKVDTSINLLASGSMRTAHDLMFTPFTDDNGEDKWQSILEIPIDDDMVDEDHGSITVTLNASPTAKSLYNFNN